jgi:hypothetical protein
VSSEAAYVWRRGRSVDSIPQRTANRESPTENQKTEDGNIPSSVLCLPPNPNRLHNHRSINGSKTRLALAVVCGRARAGPYSLIVPLTSVSTSQYM